MAISYSVVNALKERCKNMSASEINEKIEHYEQFANSLNLNEQTKLAILNYVKYMAVSENIRAEYEALVDALKNISKTKGYIDSMYHLEKSGRIIGATPEIMADTKRKKVDAESQIINFVNRKELLERQKPDLLLKENMLSLDEIARDVLTSMYFENLMKIKVLKDELQGRLKYFGEQPQK